MAKVNLRGGQKVYPLGIHMFFAIARWRWRAHPSPSPWHELCRKLLPEGSGCGSCPTHSWDCSAEQVTTPDSLLLTQRAAAALEETVSQLVCAAHGGAHMGWSPASRDLPLGCSGQCHPPQRKVWRCSQGTHPRSARSGGDPPSADACLQPFSTHWLIFSHVHIHPKGDSLCRVGEG